MRSSRQAPVTGPAPPLSVLVAWTWISVKGHNRTPSNYSKTSLLCVPSHIPSVGVNSASATSRAIHTRHVSVNCHSPGSGVTGHDTMTPKYSRCVSDCILDNSPGRGERLCTSTGAGHLSSCSQVIQGITPVERADVGDTTH